MKFHPIPPRLRHHLDRAVHAKKTVQEMGAFEGVCPRRTRHQRDFDRLVGTHSQKATGQTVIFKNVIFLSFRDGRIML